MQMTLSEDSENTAADPEQEQQKIKETILSEFEYGRNRRFLTAHCSLKNGSCISRSNIGNLNRRSEGIRQSFLPNSSGEQMLYLLQTGQERIWYIYC